MNKQRAIGIIVILVLFLLILVVSIGAAQDTDSISLEEIEELLAEGEPAYTLEEATALLEKLVPLVEDATGRKFDKIPEIKLANRDEMTSILSAEFAQELEYQGQADDDSSLSVADTSAACAAVILGKYSILDKSLYLMPGNMWPIFKIANVDTKHKDPLLELIIIHELVHALQDQETGLERVWQVAGDDASSAFWAAIEGQAVFVQEAVGRQMGLEESVIEMSRLLAAGAVTFDDPVLEMINQIVATQYEQIYLGGRRFIEYHYAQGGNERIWEIIARPPVKTSMITKPETYDYVKRDETDYASLLTGLENELGRGDDWQVQNVEMGEMSLRTSYVKMEAEFREKIISHIEHAQALVAINSMEEIFSVSVVFVKDPAIFVEYIAELEKMVEKNVQEMASSSLVGIDNFVIKDFAYTDAEIARVITYTVYD